MTKLQIFLREAAARQFKMGDWDCGLWLADWYIVATGKPDPAYDLRNTSYSITSLIPNLRSIVRRTNLTRTHTPKSGDIGLIRIGNLAHGAIFTGSRWAVLGKGGGLSTTPNWYPCMASWRVE